MEDKKMPMHRKAKMDLLKQLRRMAMDMIHEDSMGGEEDAAGLQKVTVAAKDKEGLKQGLEKAEDVLEDMPELAEADDAEEDAEDPAELEAKIAELQAKLAKVKA
jgi:hypothetical protein